MWPVAQDYSNYRNPAVPVDLIRYTCGYDDYDQYLLSGFEVASMLNLALNKNVGRLVADFSRVLDFGCGSGRIARFMNPSGEFYGCDVNRAVAEFCAATIPHGDFHQNALMPPLRFAADSFDLVYSFSVFSHLRLDVEQAWLAELARIGAPGCVYLLTIQGDWMIEATLGADADAARAAGFSYRSVHQRHNTEADFPDYYESSYHTSAWVRQHWSEYFDIVDIIKGDDPARYLAPGQAFVPQGDVPRLRPMGQDLVVAVKRNNSAASAAA